MRCLSPHSRYSLQVIEGEEQVVVQAGGGGGIGMARTITTKKPVIANFQQQGLLDHEIEAALEHFNFSGLPEGINPLTRISVYDTEAAFAYLEDDEERSAIQAKVEARLRKHAVRFPSEFIIVETPSNPKPWPSYDEDTAEDVLFLQSRLRINPEKVRLYELENENRPEIIEAMYRQEDPDGASVLFGPQSDEEIIVRA